MQLLKINISVGIYDLVWFFNKMSKMYLLKISISVVKFKNCMIWCDFSKNTLFFCVCEQGMRFSKMDDLWIESSRSWHFLEPSWSQLRLFSCTKSIFFSSKLRFFPSAFGCWDPSRVKRYTCQKWSIRKDSCILFLWLFIF